MNRALSAALLLLLAPARALAGFDDSGFGPRDTGMGGAFTAVSDDPAVMAYNPGALGMASALEAQAAYQRRFHVPGGESDRDQSRAAAVVPVREGVQGAFGFDVRYDRRTNVASDRSIGVYYGTRGLREREHGGLDFGGGFKLLNTAFASGGGGASHLALDFGGLWRFSDRYALGASLLNFGSPKFRSGPISDRAPLALKVGVAEQLRGATLAMDATKREPSAGLPGEVTFAAGFERWWSTARLGQYALRSGLSMGDESRTWSWGLGWRTSGARLDYAMTVPLSGVARFGHAVSLSLRFGRSDPEAEYEKLLAQELAYRKRLGDALEAGSVKQWKLSEELARLREETAALKQELGEKKASESQARRRLEEVEKRRRDAASEYERLQKERAGASLRTRETLFREDWRAYERAKLAGATDGALLDHVGRLLREYKDSGVDLSDANQELLRLERARGL